MSGIAAPNLSGQVVCRRVGLTSRAEFTLPCSVGIVNGGVNPALRRKGEVGVWQPGFLKHQIRDKADLSSHVRYCWANPVKHGLTARPTDWPQSSIYRDIRLGRVDAGCARGAPDGEFGE